MRRDGFAERDATATRAGICILCGEGPTRLSRQFSSPAWTVVECSACSTRYVDPIPELSTLASYYEYDAYGRLAYDRCATATETRVSDLVRLLGVARTHGLPPGRLLDVGCSTGQLLVAARRGGWIPQGVEIDPRTAAVAEERSGSSVRVGTGLEALAADEEFEVITMSHWLEHSPAPRRQLELASDHLVPGGGLLVRVPNTAADAPRCLGWGWRWFSPPVHLFYFTEAGLRRVANQVGLQAVWANLRQGDAWSLPIELAVGYGRRLNPWSRSHVPQGMGPRASAESPLVQKLTRLAEALNSYNPLRPWENSELVMLLRRPQEVGGADSPS